MKINYPISANSPPSFHDLLDFPKVCLPASKVDLKLQMKKLKRFSCKKFGNLIENSSGPSKYNLFEPKCDQVDLFEQKCDQVDTSSLVNLNI